MSTPFDPATAQYIDGLGTGSISGRTFLAGTFSGKFANLQLIPVTAYSMEYMKILFDGDKAYYKPVVISNVDSNFRRYQRRTRADDKGNFTFSGVPAGEYFVYSQLLEDRTGVALYERVSIGKGQKLRVDVTGT